MKIGLWLALKRRHFNFNKEHKISGGKLSRDRCDENESKIQYYFDLVREAEVILLTFSRGKSILLLNCSLDVQ